MEIEGQNWPQTHTDPSPTTAVHLPLSTNWVDIGAEWSLLSVSSLKANPERRGLSIWAAPSWFFYFHGLPLCPNSQGRAVNMNHFLHLSNPLTRHDPIVAPCVEMAEPNYTPYHRYIQHHSFGIHDVTIFHPTCDANANPVKRGQVQHNPQVQHNHAHSLARLWADRS